ncbi:MAG: leucine-rich repeat protein [Oscillospiraceae bacterium]|jgi:uncharacterized repeat protein (TIGR02543 family)|nr:leucine-rich repeat protein [Oscillospiraceae bacterium]
MKKKLLSVFLSLAMAAGVVLVPNGGLVAKSGAITSGDWEYTLNFDLTATITKYNGTAADVKISTKIDGYKVVEVRGSNGIFSNNGIFSGNGNVKSVTVPKNIKIGAYAFASTKNLTEVTIEKGITAIGNYAFDNCANLTSVKIPNSVTEIGTRAFMGCTALREITLPSGLAKIESDTFSGCTGLTSIKIPNSVTEIGTSAFSRCTALQEITLPSGLAKIYMDAFSGCTGLASVRIPDSVTTIGMWAFSNCKNLTSVVIPGGVTTISSGAFSGRNERLVITGVKGSKAEEHAKNYNIPFLANLYHVSFDLNGGGDAPAGQSVEKNKLLSKPKNPVRAGYDFGGWYKEKSCKTKWDFTKDKVTKSTTLYAKWTVGKLAAPKSPKAAVNSKSKITVSWKKVSGADGYEVRRATSKSGSYKKVGDVSKGDTVKYANTKLTANKTYYYKVRAYKVIDGKKVYGKYTAVVSAKTKK